MAQFLHYVVLFSAYAVLWFLCLFCLLPVGLGAARDPESGAPLNPMLKKKALIASGSRRWCGWASMRRSASAGSSFKRQTRSWQQTPRR